jgi:DNA polymerase III subunit epsilon
MYAIIDIETTGGKPKRDKITEIAVIVHDGKGVVREYTSLINPECRIPHHISALTGITNEMVANAPKFYEIARELVEMTQNSVFVAHNVSFDYGFIRSEFQQLGYDFKREQLCTVKLSRKIVPGHASYSLGRLCDDLGISVHDRHRAYGDAQATVLLFEYLLKKESDNNTRFIEDTGSLGIDLHPSLDTRKIKELPDIPGVYYFYNQDAELIYIGKSKNIHSRVVSHFSSNATSKAIRMKTQITDVGFETTGSELVALLKESFEIKKHKPLFNRRQRRSLFRYVLCSYMDSNGYRRYELKKTTEMNQGSVMCFNNKTEAMNFLSRMIEKYDLCQKLCGIYPTEGNCFHYEIGACKGACIGLEPPEQYNKRAAKVTESFDFGLRNLLIIDAGRNKDEKSVVKIENGKYLGYGYFSPEYANQDPDSIHECITCYPDDREILQIIKQYLRNNKVEKIIAY